MLLDYALQESKKGERVVDENDDWIMVVPYWAAWPYELLLLPKHEIKHLNQLTQTSKNSLSEILSLSLKTI